MAGTLEHPHKTGYPARGAEEIEHIDAVARAIELRRDNLTYQQIADEMGVSWQTANRYVKKGMARILEEHGALEVRAREMALLEAVTQRVMPALLPDPKPVLLPVFDANGDAVKNVHKQPVMIEKVDKDGEVVMNTPLPDLDYIDRYIKIHNAKVELVGARVDKKMNVQVTVDDEALERVEFMAGDFVQFMDVMDKIATTGYGSGRMAQGELDAAREQEEREMQPVLSKIEHEIIDAEVVEDEIVHGEWIDGRLVIKDGD